MTRTKQALSSIRAIFRDPDDLTYYPEQERKSRGTILKENLQWLFRYHEVNHFYYLWGCDRREAPPLFDYACKKTFCQKRDWINAHARIGGRVFNYNCLLQDKFVFAQFLEGLGFPVPKCLALCTQTHIRLLEPYRVQPLADFIASQEMDCFIKDVLGERAERVYKLHLSGGKIRLNNTDVSFEAFRDSIGPMNLLQETVHQHPLLAEINPCSVNTIRVITARKQSAIVPLSAMLRVGSQKGTCDNLASGGLAVGIDLAAGTLGEWGFYKPGHGKRTKAHPDTGFVFKDVRLPFFETAIRMLQELHRYFYGCHSIGWDVVITPDGPVLLEGNNSWEIPTLQVFDNKLIDKYNATLTNPS